MLKGGAYLRVAFFHAKKGAFCVDIVSCELVRWSVICCIFTQKGGAYSVTEYLIKIRMSILSCKHFYKLVRWSVFSCFYVQKKQNNILQLGNSTK